MDRLHPYLGKVAERHFDEVNREPWIITCLLIVRYALFCFNINFQGSCGLTGGQMDGLSEGPTDGQSDKWMVGGMDGRTAHDYNATCKAPTDGQLRIG